MISPSFIISNTCILVCEFVPNASDIPVSTFHILPYNELILFCGVCPTTIYLHFNSFNKVLQYLRDNCRPVNVRSHNKLFGNINNSDAMYF